MVSSLNVALKTVSLIAACAALLAACKSSDDATGETATGGAGGQPGATGGRGSGAEGGAPDTTTREVLPTDERIRYTGRIDFTDEEQPTFSSPGVYEEMRFRGDAVTVRIKDQYQDGKNNYYDVFIDDQEPIKLIPQRRVFEYPIDVDLEYGEHTVTVAKRTEATIGWGKFLGFRVNGQIIDPGIERSRKLVFVGDSITAGSGVDATNGSAECSEDGWGQPYHNVDHSYAVLAARSFDADYHVTAVSGIGLVQNYDTRWDARTMPDVYDLLYLEQKDSPAWDTDQFVPDAIVIALGTNDFSTGEPSDPANTPPLIGAGGAGGADGAGEPGGAGGADDRGKAGGAGGAGGVDGGGEAGGAGGVDGAGEGGAAGGVAHVSSTGGASSAEPDPNWHRATPTPADYAESYIAFIETLRGYYGKVPVFCLQSPMLGNHWPNAEDTFRDDLNDSIQLVVEHYADAGDDTVYEVPIDQITGRGCGTHPDADQHEAIADELVDVMGPAMGWD